MTLFRLGLTGSIGMGKSTTAAFFRDAGLPVWDADEAVSRLYAPGGAAVGPLGTAFPKAVRNGQVDRSILKQAIANESAVLGWIEAIVHPLTAHDRAHFAATAQGDIAVFDIPLLFEKGYQSEMDATVLVTAPPTLQKRRVMARPGMTGALFVSLLARQMPDPEKRSLATHILETLDLETTRMGVRALITYIRAGASDA